MEHDFSSHIKKYKSGDTVFSEGDEGSTMYFIHSGEIRIEKKVGEKSELLATLQKGDFFGEMSLLDQAARSATAIVETDAELLEVNGENFETLLSGNIEIAIRMIRKYISRLRDTNDKLHHALDLKNKMDQEILEIVKTTEAPPKLERVKPIAMLEVGSPPAHFFMYEYHASIGRVDPATGLTPDIDLTAVDAEKTVSRKHAKLHKKDDGSFEIMEEVGVRNGTLVNDVKITSGKYVPLSSGSKLQLGKVICKFMTME